MHEIDPDLESFEAEVERVAPDRQIRISRRWQSP